MDDSIKLKNDSYLPLRDVVFEALRDAILTGVLQPGERLPEVQLAKRLGVSRTPLREALHMLERERLVVMQPRRGACVADISPKMLKDVLEVRCALEELAVELACRNMNDDYIAQLRTTVDHMREAIRKKNARTIVQYDEEFHNIIYTAADNQKLSSLIANLREQMFRFRYEYVKDEETRATVLGEHEEIIELLQNRDVEAAKACMKAHIKLQEQTITKNIVPIVKK